MRALAASLERIRAGRVTLEGELELPAEASGVVVFSHGSGSGRHSPRNQHVAGELRRAGLGTLLMDLLTPEEDRDPERRFDIALLTERLAYAADHVLHHAAAKALPLGLFGASTGAASALRVAARMPHAVRAVVSRGGRPDLASRAALGSVQAPTLLIVGGADFAVLEVNEEAAAELTGCVHQLAVVPHATHLFEEPGTLEEVARLAAGWFRRYLKTE
jgi:putative phosphoribosyl transferase